MSKKKSKELTFEDLELHTNSILDEMSFDIDSEHSEEDHPEILIYRQMLSEATSKIIKYEKFLQDKNLMEEADSSFISDEEIICLQGIETIKQLVIARTFTKDDINAFDILHRNLCLIRNIKIDKNSKKKSNTPSSRDELLKLVSKK